MTIKSFLLKAFIAFNDENDEPHSRLNICLLQSNAHLDHSGALIQTIQSVANISL